MKPLQGNAHPSALQRGHDGVSLTGLTQRGPNGRMKQQIHGRNDRSTRETLSADPPRLLLVHHGCATVRRGIRDGGRLPVTEGVLCTPFGQRYLDCGALADLHYPARSCANERLKTCDISVSPVSSGL